MIGIVGNKVNNVSVYIEGSFLVVVIRKIIVKMFCMIKMLMVRWLWWVLFLLFFFNILIMYIVLLKLRVKVISVVFFYVSLLMKFVVIVFIV